MKLGDIIKEYRITNKLTMQEFSKISGLSKGYISMLEKNKHPQNNKEIVPSIDTFYKVATAMNISLNALLEKVSPDQIISLQDDPTEPSNVTPVEINQSVRIPVYGRIPAGVPIEAIEDIETYIDVDADIVENNSIIALRVVGSSMYPKYLDGDIVVIKCQPDCENGQDCAVRVNGDDVTLKKVYKEVDGILLQPINPEYMAHKYDYHDELNPVSIIGVIIELRRKI